MTHPARTSAGWRRAGLVASCVYALAGCGRIGFSAIRDGAGDTLTTDGLVVVSTTGVGGKQVVDVALDATSAFAVTGSYGGTLALGGLELSSPSAQHDLFVAAFEPDGRPRWLRGAGSTDLAEGQGIGWQPDGGVRIAGYFSGTLTQLGGIDSGSGQNALLETFDAAGTPRVAASYGGDQNVQIRGFDQLAGRYAIGGSYVGALDLGGGAAFPFAPTDNGFVAVFDASSAVVWARAFPAAGNVYLNDVALGVDGSLCITGLLATTADFGAGPLTASPSDGFVARFDAAGLPTWARQTSAAGDDQGDGVAVLPGGDCVAIGSDRASFAFDGLPVDNGGGLGEWLARFDGTTGAARWVRSMTGAGEQRLFAVTADVRGQIAVSGRVEGTAMVLGTPMTSAGSSDGFIAVLGDDGAVLSTLVLGGSGDVQPLQLAGIATDPAGTHVIAAMSYTGELVVGGRAMTATDLDAVIVVLPTP